MTLDEIKSSFAKNSLHVDLADIRLTQNLPQEDAIKFIGKGYIRQTPDGKIIYKLYTTEVHNTDWIKHLGSYSNIKSGDLFKEDSYYSFEALDYSGNQWIAERVLISVDWVYEHQSALVFGHLDKLELKHKAVSSSHSKSKFAALHFYEDLSLRDVLSNPQKELINSPYHFTISKFDGGFTIRVDSEDDLPQHIDTRIVEAARVVTANSLFPKFLYKHGSYFFNSSFDKSAFFKLGKPAARNEVALWNLFLAYFNYIIVIDDSAVWHDLSGFIHGAREASANSFEAYAVGLSVAVEGITNIIEIQRNENENTEHIKQQNHNVELKKYILDSLDKSCEFRPYKKRIENMLGSINQVRAIDKLRWLSSMNKIDEKHYKAWRAIRNPSVHPSVNSELDFCEHNFQIKINELFIVADLLYRLIFYIIDYKGIYTDYSLKNWPCREYI